MKKQLSFLQTECLFLVEKGNEKQRGKETNEELDEEAVVIFTN
jgi:hypothetical protein